MTDEHIHEDISPMARRAMRHEEELAAAVQERTDWLYRHLCDALGIEPVPNPTAHDWDVAVARVRRLAEATP